MKKILLFLVAFLVGQLCIAQDTIIKYNGDIILAKITEVTPTEVKYKKFDFQDGPNYVDKKTDIVIIKYSNGMKEHFDRQPEQVSPTPSYNKPSQTTPDYYGGSSPSNNYSNDKITEFGSRFSYQNRLISEREMRSILMNTRDKKIMGLVQESKQAQGLQFIGFGGIVFGVAALYFLELSLITTPQYNSSTGYQTSTQNPNKNGLQTAAAACAIIGIACPIASGVFKAKRKKCNREAINLYNQKY